MAEIYMQHNPLCYEDMKKYKLSATPDEICCDTRTLCMRELLEEAYSYEYADTPRYGLLKFMMEK